MRSLSICAFMLPITDIEINFKRQRKTSATKSHTPLVGGPVRGSCHRAVTGHQRYYGRIPPMTRQGNARQRRLRRIRLLCNFMFFVAGVIPLVDWRFGDGIEHAGQIAQVVSAPLAAFAAIGLAGVYKSFKGLDDSESPASPPAGKPPPFRPNTQWPPPWRPLCRHATPATERGPDA